MEFEEKYSKLNPAQKQAVDQIDGPVMVIAGPGTGKTELLSIRVANILKKTDTLPQNILCLTFTESGASSMRKRLTEIIGQDAYRVTISTFHSFCVDIINQNSQYFFNNAIFSPTDELTCYEIINNILTEVSFDNPLKTQQDGEYTQIKKILTAISQIKNGGLSCEELSAILDQNDNYLSKCEPIIQNFFVSKINKLTINLAKKAVEQIRAIKLSGPIPGIVPLPAIIADSLENAVNAAGEKDTKPITAWKNLWLKKDNNKQFIFKSKERQVRLRALNEIYNKYIDAMRSKKLFDYDDMILQVVQKIEQFDDLRYSLQEQYQYILVDEFQDTNMAQMRILYNLTNNPAQENKPNILIVGDDDQAIYSFQGADVSNIIDFRNNFQSTKVITLTENYRSGDDILQNSRDVITQGQNRLEKVFSDINKQLHAAKVNQSDVSLVEIDSIISERQYVAKSIRRQIDSGTDPTQIAVIAREHKEIYAILPHLYKEGILVNYERKDNVLEQEIIKIIEDISSLLLMIQSGSQDDVNGLMPNILAHPAWGIEPVELWRLSVQAYDNHLRWLEMMSTSDKFSNLANWIIGCAKATVNTPLEQILDIIIGKSNLDNSDFISPIYEYYFSEEKLKDNPEQYLILLESLRSIREKIRDYHQDQTPTLQTFVEYINLNRKAGNRIETTRKSAHYDDAINVMTAHKSKGLEFDSVYIINAVDSNWNKNNGGNGAIIFPENLPLAPAGDSDDEKLRLFYVAMTRARFNLIISFSKINSNGKETELVRFLSNQKIKPQTVDIHEDIDQAIENSETVWYERLTNPISPTMKNLLQDKLDNYKLSPTHLNNFIDVTRGGPQMFMLNNLLNFPSAKSPSADYGTSIHHALQQAHNYLISTNKRMPIDQVIESFVNDLSKQHLSKSDEEHFRQKGINSLTIFLKDNYDIMQPDQMTEFSFANQHSVIDDVRLTGKLDIIDINKTDKTVTVVDYKTGNAPEDESGNTDYEKIKIHKYKQQLMFYKLLIESSRDYHEYTVKKGIIQFVEPTKSGKIAQIETDFSSEDIEKFKKLVSAVWSHIIDLNFPDISGYDPTLNGIIKFESDLVEGKE